MADETKTPPPGDERPLGLAGFLEEEEAEWQGLMSRVHNSIARREVAGQAVELGMQGWTSVLIEYLKAVFGAFGGSGGKRRVD